MNVKKTRENQKSSIRTLPSLSAALLLLCSPLIASAEYRVFQLEITDTRSNQSRQINSVLDDKQYSGYFPVQPYEKISILNTWMCRGRQGDFKALCPNPKAEPTEPSSKSSADDI